MRALALVLMTVVLFAEEKPDPIQAAYREATRMKDQAQKVIALDEFLKKYPASMYKDGANEALLEALVKSNGAPQRVRSQVKLLVKGKKGSDFVFDGGNAARVLSEDKQYLAEAEKMARKALKEASWETFLKEEKASAAKAKKELPAEARLRATHKSNMAYANQTMAMVLDKQGKSAEAEKFYAMTLEANPMSSVAALALAKSAESRNDSAKATEYYVRAALIGGSKETREKAQALLKDKKLDDVLDAEYHKIYPPLHAEKYKPTEKRTKRTVLAELFTGAGCAPCVAADIAFDAEMERYSRDEVAVLMYHQHIPRPDPLSNPDSSDRYTSYNARGVPTFAIDGKHSTGGGPLSAAPSVMERIEKTLVPRLDTAPAGTLKMNAVRNGGVIQVSVEATDFKPFTEKQKLRVTLAEKLIRYSGESGIRFHPMVVRSVAVQPAAEKAACEFDLAKIRERNNNHLEEYEKTSPRKFLEKPDGILTSKFAVVAFIEDSETKEVLQTAQVELEN